MLNHLFAAASLALCGFAADFGPLARDVAVPVAGKMVAPVVERGVVYATRKVGDESVELKLNIAMPATDPTKVGEDGKPEAKVVRRPCIVCIHGGGWTAVKREDLDGLIQRFAGEGFVAATVSYRFAPANRFPAQIEDCAEAVRYLRENAERFGIDPQRVGAIGFSAGAHLAMLLATGDVGDGLGIEAPAKDAKESKDAKDAKEVGTEKKVTGKVGVAISFFGPTQLGGADIPVTSKGLVAGLVGKEADGLAERFKAASPMTYLNKGDAPMLLFQGTKDPLVPMTQATVMIDAMGKAGVPGRAEMISGAGHGFGGAEGERTYRVSMEFLRQYLREPDAKK
ncbi:MAG: alpha/beta hydrolase [Planctomycetota bacterium]